MPVLIVAGLVIVALAIWLVIAMRNGGLGGVNNLTTHGSEGTIADKTVAVANIERLPMSDARCDDVILLLANKEGRDCIIADVAITNNSNEAYEFNPLLLRTIDPKQNGEPQFLPPYKDDSTRMARVMIEPGESFNYKLYVVAETGQELDLSFASDEEALNQGAILLFDLT